MFPFAPLKMNISMKSRKAEIFAAYQESVLQLTELESEIQQLKSAKSDQLITVQQYWQDIRNRWGIHQTELKLAGEDFKIVSRFFQENLKKVSLPDFV